MLSAKTMSSGAKACEAMEKIKGREMEDGKRMRPKWDFRYLVRCQIYSLLWHSWYGFFLSLEIAPRR